MGMNGPQPPAGGLLGMIAAIPQYIQALKVQKQQQQLQTMLAGNQQLDIFRQQAATPGFKPTPEWTAAVTKIAKDSGLGAIIPFQQGSAPAGGAPQGPAANSTGGGAAPLGGAGNLTQTQAPTGPQIDLNAFTGRNPFADFVQKNLVNLEETDPQKRGSLATAELGRAPSADEEKQLEGLPQQLPPAQQEAERKAIDTVVGRGLAQAGKTGTAAALTAAVKFNYSRMQKAGYTDDEINALLDPSLDKLSPMELEKIAEGKATAGLKDAQANFLRESASAKIEKYHTDAQAEATRAHALQENADSTRMLVGPRAAALKAQVMRAFNSAATAASTNAKNNAEAKWYSERAVDLQTEGDPRQTIAALSSIRSAKASTDAGIRSIESNITRIQSSLTYGDPSSKTALDQSIAKLNGEKQLLEKRSQEYDSALTTLSTKMAPGSGLQQPAAAPGAATTSPVTGAQTGTQPAAPPQGAVHGKKDGVPGYLYPDGTWHPD